MWSSLWGVEPRGQITCYHSVPGDLTALDAEPFIGVKMPDMPMPASGGIHTHHAMTMSIARQAQIIALTLAVLAVAVWLAARVAPIRL
jgi:hypothetical protein